MRQGFCLAAAILGIILLLVVALGRLNSLVEPTLNRVAVRGTGTLVLDAGHGGEDGGAVSDSGTVESQINLAIVLNLRDVLGLYGVDPVLLREEDVSLHDENADTLREKKASDLKNRVKAIEGMEEATLISVHQNTYPNSRYRGAQVFFAPTEGSKELAEYFQTFIQTELQPDNQRTSKQIPETVYLMNHISCPGILVECGFLTSPEEEANLRNPGYQRQFASVLAGAWLTASDPFA